VPATTPLADRISLFGITPGGIQLVSDVTTARPPAQRPANIRRVLGLIARAARSLGDAAVFESSGPALWRQLTLATENLLDAFWQAGALNGATARAAYSVECGATTMSQADLDAGRVIVRIAVVPAASVERIEVSLVLTEGGLVNDGGVPLGEAA
jgi:phage tail sheath protein FI